MCHIGFGIGVNPQGTVNPISFVLTFLTLNVAYMCASSRVHVCDTEQLS